MRAFDEYAALVENISVLLDGKQQTCTFMLGINQTDVFRSFKRSSRSDAIDCQSITVIVSSGPRPAGCLNTPKEF